MCALLVSLAESLQRLPNQANKKMARATFSEIITALSGKIGGHVWTTWNGIPVCKTAPSHMRVAYESLPRKTNLIKGTDCIRAWEEILTQEQKDGWEDYADYLATLPTNYVKLTGLKNYGGVMAGYNAYTLVNVLRLSIGLTDLLNDAPLGESNPTTAILESLTYLYSANPTLRATIRPPASLSEPTYARIHCRGTRYAHLIQALYAQVQADALSWPTIDYIPTVLPPSAIPPWTLIGAEYGTIVFNQLHLVYTTFDEDDRYKRTINYAPAYTAEITIRVERATYPLALRLFLDPGGGTYYYPCLYFYEDKIGIDYKPGPRDYVAIDLTDKYHKIRMTVDDTTLKVYDGTTLLATKTMQGEAGAIGSSIDFGCSYTFAIAKFWVSRLRYLQGADAAPVQTEYEWSLMRYAQGKELKILDDTYKAQVDYLTEYGRFGPPSAIKATRVSESFVLGLWGSEVWDNLQWGSN